MVPPRPDLFAREVSYNAERAFSFLQFLAIKTIAKIIAAGGALISVVFGVLKGREL